MFAEDEAKHMHITRKIKVFVALSGVNGCDDPDGLAESSRAVCLSMGSKMYGSFKHKFEVIGLKEHDDPCGFAEDTH